METLAMCYAHAGGRMQETARLAQIAQGLRLCVMRGTAMARGYASDGRLLSSYARATRTDAAQWY
eukprot:1096383-Rhodomonas_salina.2